jgi:Fur family transcriptional regulator, ferric uptake regulator
LQLFAHASVICDNGCAMSCIRALQSRGYRLTPQRIMVINALHGAKSHVSADEVFERLRRKYPYSNISTVYRTLELLKDLGLAAEISVGDGIKRYHARDNSRHHHLLCTGCGKMFDLSEEELVPLEEALIRNHGFKADIHHLAIFGLCSDCGK